MIRGSEVNLKDQKRRRVHLRTGRFDADLWLEFFRDVAQINRESWQETPAELAVRTLSDSLENDLRPGVRGHLHGLDAKTVTLREIQEHRNRIGQELGRLRAEILKREVQLLETFLRSRERALDVQSTGDANLADTRTREIREARLRIVARSDATNSPHNVQTRERREQEV